MGLKKVGALWIKKGKKGTFMSGQLELEGRNGPKTTVFVFKNEKKEPGDKYPDYLINVSDGEDDRQSKPTPADDELVPF